MQNKERKSNSRAITKKLNAAIHNFMKGEAAQAFSLVGTFDNSQLSVTDQGNIQKVTLLLLVGSLYDITTLKELLSLFGIKSNNYSKIWKKLTHRQVYDLFTLGSRSIFKEKFVKLVQQSASTQSRAELTIVGDDSTFKQWLKNAENDPYYGVFFSGQYKKMVHGFCVSLVGVVLNDTFYPLSFRLIPKPEPKVEEIIKKEAETATEKEKKEKKEKAVQEKQAAEKKRKKSLIELEKGIKDVYNFIVKLSQEAKADLPQLYLSLDSGFSNKELLDFCDKLHIITISVAKPTEVLFYKDEKMNFKTLIETIFLAREADYNAENKDNGAKKAPFLLRLKVFYQKLARMVTIVIFRFNGSDKVTIIFCYDDIIHAKTMRRRFFQRTQIEQFFRMVKHTLHIEQSTSNDSKSFIKKVALFFLKAIFAFAFRDYCRKHYRQFKKYSFYKLRKNIVFNNVDKTVLTDLLF
jgi:hypothetical protein